MTCDYRYNGNRCSLSPYGECNQDSSTCQRAEAFRQRLIEIKPQVSGRLSDVQGIVIYTHQQQIHNQGGANKG